LYLEITESAYNNETDQIIGIINELRDLGFKIEIDDFGSGYSSLNTLATLSFDCLKLDMKFVHDMFKNDKTLKMVGIVSDIAKYLNVKLVAEGVETKEQLDKLKQFNYDIIQGYYFSKPLPNDEFENLFGKEFK
jgi:EAL domain-containing protein (putative c-di-GMP-specific phosphodiesterase class I)